jgi:hypothetical protein
VKGSIAGAGFFHAHFYQVINMAIPEEFQVLYETHLKPKLITFEAKRKKIVIDIIFLFIGYIILMIALFVVFVLLTEQAAPQGEDNPFILILIIGTFVITSGFSYLYNRWVSPYKKSFKKEIVSRIVTFIDDDLIYYPEKQITWHEFQSSLLVQYWWRSVDRWSGEDYVQGILGKTAVKFSEVHAEERKRRDNSRRYITVFKGLFFIFDFNKAFEGFTVVLPERIWPYRIYGDLVKLEDPEFEEEFVVYSDNQITARYILSPSLMRRLLKFRRELGKKVYLSFVNGRLYMGISIDKNLFEPKIFRTILNFQLIHEYLEYMQLGKDIVEELNLNLRVWSKIGVKDFFQGTGTPILTSDHLKNMIGGSR